MNKIRSFSRIIFLLAFYIILLLNYTQASTDFFRENSGREIKFENLSLEEGLSQVSVYCILQDHRGFLWFGTRDGLNKYDGYSFTVYKHNPFDSTSLSNNKIKTMYEDHRGILWIGTDEGLNKFNRECDCFSVFKKDPQKANSLIDNRINSIIEDSNGNLWIGTSGGINRLDKNRTQFTKYSFELNQEKDPMVTVIYEDTKGIIWIGTDHSGLYYFDKIKKEIVSFKIYSNNKIGLIENKINTIYEDEAGYLWIGGANGLLRLNPENKQVKAYEHTPVQNSLSHNSVTSIIRDQTGLFWIGTDHGLNLFDEDSNTFKTYFHEQDYSNTLSNDVIYSIYEDKAGVIWIGTFGGGINKYNPHNNRFAHFKNNPHSKNSLNNNFVYAFYEDDNKNLWIGTNEGLNRFDRKNSRFTLFKNEPGNPNSLSNNFVRCIHEDRDGFLWIGTYDGLNRYDSKTGTFKKYKNEQNNKTSLSNNLVITIYEDQAGDMWLGTGGGGLNRYDKKADAFTTFKFDTMSPLGNSSNFIYRIHQDKNNVIWLGTYGGGLIKFDAARGQVKVYQYEVKNSNSLSSNFVYTIHGDRRGILWLGTYGAGLISYDPQNEIFTHFGMNDGLPNNLVYGILEDDKGFLWISTNFGISKFNPNAPRSEFNFRNYDKSQGLQSNEFNFGAYYKNEGGEMFFGGVNGFNVFHPDSIKDLTYIPPVVITALELLHKPLKRSMEQALKKSIAEGMSIELDYANRAIGFEFSALDYSNPLKNLFSYKLDGIDKDWIFTTAKRRYAQYNNLSGGEYTFRVRGSNSDGLWNMEGVSLRIKITHPYWDTWWFKIGLGMVLLLFVSALFKLRTDSIRKRNEQLQRINLTLENEISERIKAEENLRTSEEKYRTITDNINAGIYRNIPQLGGEFVEVNPALVKIFGYETKEEVLNLSVSDLYFEKKERNRFRKKIIRKGFVKDEELQLKKKDGTPIWCSVTAVAVYDQDGKIKYYDGLVEDITERKRVQEALQESEEKYRILVERANDGILILKKGLVAYVNPRLANMAGYSLEELIGSPFIQYVHADERAKILERYAKRLNNENIESTYETILLHKDGRKLITEINAGLIIYEGEPADLVFLRDITDRKQLEVQIRQNQKMQAIGHLAGGVAHDFNNILTVINGHAELAQFRMSPTNRGYKHVTEIIKSAQRASDLIRQLLAFSRQQIIEPKIIDVNQVIQGLDKMLHRVIGEDIQIVSALYPDLPPIKADPGQIEQVLMNLIINARDAIIDNPKPKSEKIITIKTNKVFLDEEYVLQHLETRMGPHILISIIDTGKGMDEDTIERIFDPFFTTKEQGKGTGLGLATVFGIVKQNEGNILVESKPGKGTTFKVYWPYIEDMIIPPADEIVQAMQVSGQENILLVEDDAKVRHFAREALESHGYSVIEAANGLEALEILRNDSKEIDLLLSDVVMPEMGGQELAEEVKGNYPELKVILVSGYTDSQIIRDGTREHAMNFLYKPFSIQSLLKKVREVLDVQ